MTSAQVSFVGADTTTQGNWKSKYGTDGYVVIDDSTVNATYGSVTPTLNSNYIWTGSTSDVRALQKAVSATDRIAATWYSWTQFKVDVNITGTHQLAAYFVDWDNMNRIESVDVLDASTNTVLDTRSISSFANGEYLVWNVTGHVILRLTSTGASGNAVLSGLFFGGNATPAASASFVMTDTSTQGNWKAKYGAEGYTIIDDSSVNPSYGSGAPSLNSNYIWAASTADVRGLQKSSSATDRIAATWYASTQFYVDVNISGTHQLAAYFVDWDSLGRVQTVDVLDAATNAVLDTHNMSNFVNGAYLVWNITGHVKLRLTCTAGANTVISGLLFGGPLSPPPSTTGPAASFVGLDTSTQGNWQSKYGVDGYTVIDNSAIAPTYGSVMPSLQSNYIWASSTTDVRALQKSTSTDRIAATWYSSTQFFVDVNITGTHQLAAYFVDWDSLNRVQTVDVLDPNTNAVLDTRNVSNFVNGVYLVWNITGHVKLRLTCTGGMNTVISGLFFGGAVSTPAPAVSVSITPATANLLASNSQQFTATVANTTNTAVTWSLSPQVGTLSNGLYTAPSSVSSAQTITVTATSAADPTKFASASVTLAPVVIVVSPSSASLSAGQTKQFSISISGTSNTGVTWSLSPAVGTISNGLYTAPASIPSQQVVIVTATSAADPTKSSQATITLTPPATGVSVTVTPGQASLSASQTQQFTAAVTGSTNTGVVWSLSPATGTITTGGLYTAPTSIATQQTVTVTATSTADGTKKASAIVTLQPAASSTSVQLPLEAIGLDGKTVSATFTIPPGANLTGAQLWLKLHGLHYDTQASVQVNNGAWTAINGNNVTLLGLANSYGGIGGGFHTFQMTMNLPAGAVNSGTNTITFRFNGTNGRVSGFRVLGFNVWDANGNPLIPSSAFTWDDPATWQPPSSASSDISAGKTLWYTASLSVPTSSGPAPIQAHCTDCHAQDGRDLKYFNYSNNSIRVRSMFHGLTAQQGDQIASYIRTLNVPNPGRPWNPPYQPGPGLDSQPVTNWAAGAGIDAVLQSNSQMLPYLMPGGSTANWAPSANMSAREMPIAMQLPDWNMWLPGVHPIDQWGSAFLTSQVYTNYQSLRANLVPNSQTAYAAQKGNVWQWQTYALNFINPLTLTYTDPGWSNPQYAAAVPAFFMWSMTKLWELNQEFGLEGMAQTAFGPQADTRAWYSMFPFYGSPNMEHLPNSAVGNGSAAEYLYMSQIWYHVQVVLNYSNNRGTHLSQSSDWPYVLNHVDQFAYQDNPTTDPGPLQTFWLIKGLQASENGNGPEYGSAGWALNVNDPSRFVRYANLYWGPDVSQTAKVNIIQTYLQYWIAKATSFTPTEFYQGGWASPTEIPDPVWPDHAMSNAIAFMIPQFQYLGVSSTYIDQLIAWAKTIWPAYNWDAERNAVCVPGVQHPACTW